MLALYYIMDWFIRECAEGLRSAFAALILSRLNILLSIHIMCIFLSFHARYKIV